MAGSYRFQVPPSPFAGQGNVSGYLPWVDTGLFNQTMVMGAPGPGIAGNTKKLSSVKPFEVDLSAGYSSIANGTGIKVKMAAAPAPTSYPFKIDTSADETVFFIRPDGTISSAGGVVTNKILIDMDVGQTDDPIEIKDSDDNTVFEITPEGDVKTEGAFHLQPYSQMNFVSTTTFDSDVQFLYFQSSGPTVGSPSQVVANAGGSPTVTTVTVVDEKAGNYQTGTSTIIPGPSDDLTGIFHFSTSTNLPGGVNFRVNYVPGTDEKAADIAIGAAAAVNAQASSRWSATSSGATFIITCKLVGPSDDSQEAKFPVGASVSQVFGTGMGADNNFAYWRAPKEGWYTFHYSFRINGFTAPNSAYLRSGLYDRTSNTYSTEQTMGLEFSASFPPTASVSFDRFIDPGNDEYLTPYVFIHNPAVPATFDVEAGSFSVQYLRQDPDLLT
jgi:hypothetical protein